MFDILSGKLTPSLARKLILYSNVAQLDLDPQIIEKAKEQQVDFDCSTLVSPFCSVHGEILQNLIDFSYRGMVFDPYIKTPNSFLITLLRYFDSIGQKTFIIAHKNTKLIQTINDLNLTHLPKFGQHNDEYIHEEGRIVIYIKTQLLWGSDDITKFAFQPDGFIFMFNDSIIDDSLSSTIKYIFDCMSGNLGVISRYPFIEILQILHKFPKEKHNDVFKLFGINTHLIQ